MAKDRTVTVDELRELIKTDEFTEDDFYRCFDSVSDSLEWTVFSKDWRTLFEAVMDFEPGSIGDYSVFDNFLCAAAADGFSRGIQAAACALGVEAEYLNVVLASWYEDPPDKRQDPAGFEAVEKMVADYKKGWEDRSNG